MRAVLLVAMLVLVLPPAASLETEAAKGVSVELVAEGLAMPVDLEMGPDGAIYFAELQTGKLRRIGPGAAAPDPEPLWVAPGLQVGAERGFVGLALASDFATSSRFYVFYTHNESGVITNRVSSVVDGVETPMLWELAAEREHNSGRILALDDGTVLVSVGDVTLNNKKFPDDAMHARDPEVLQGKVLRMLPDGSVPGDNPFGNLVWTLGHRNVYGLAVSPDGTVLATENGRERDDEVNILRAGGNYGWPTCIGRCKEEGIVLPVLTYTPTIAPTGAAWHRGAFYFADFNHGALHRVYPLANGTWADERVVAFAEERMLDVESGPDGLYVPTWSAIYRIVLDESWTLASAPHEPVVTTAPASRPATTLPAETAEIEAPAAIPLGPAVLAGLAAAAFARRRTP